MEVDFTGANSVSSFIQQTGLKKFIVQRIGAGKNSTPIFSYTEDGTNQQALNEFKKFASACNNSNEYELVLFDQLNDIESEEQEAPTTKRKRAKTVKITFRIKEAEAKSMSGDLNSDSIKNMFREFQNEQNNSQLAKELKELREKIEEYEEEEEETTEPKIAGFKLSEVNNIIGLLRDANIIPQAKNVEQKVALAGLTSDDLLAKKKNIENAVNMLFKNDEQLDSDLLKLASLAENSPEMFKQILTALRAM